MPDGSQASTETLPAAPQTPAPPQAAPTAWRAVLPDLAAGTGLGLLVGMLLGLSVTQVVGGVVAALSALLAGFLGLAPRGGEDRAWRTASFGLACVAGILAGLAIRSGALLAPSVEQDVLQWQRAGYPRDQALQFVAFQRLGIKPAGTTTAPPPPPGATSNALFADKAGVCARLHGLPPPVQRRILTETGDAYAGIAAAAQAASNQDEALRAGLKNLCG
jgi:hypothetical protein